MIKKCKKCKEDKPIEQFYPHKGCSGGRRPECDECRKKDMKAYRDKNPGKLREWQLKNSYGIDSAEYDRLMIKQNGLCAICFRTCPTGRRLAVDHNHATGKVRGLLCSKCNPSLGRFDESILILKSAIAYLEEHSVK